MALFVPYVVQGLALREKVVCATHDHDQSDILDCLSDSRVDPNALLDTGQLTIVPWKRIYAYRGRFSPKRTLQRWGRQRQQAMSQGFAGLRVTGEMSWAVNGLPGSNQLLRYETDVSALKSDGYVTALCQYDARRFDSDLLVRVVAAHPYLLVDGACRKNPLHLQREQVLSAQAGAHLWREALALAQERDKLKAQNGEQSAELAKTTAAMEALLGQLARVREEFETGLRAELERVLLPVLERARVSSGLDRERCFEILEDAIMRLASNGGMPSPLAHVQLSPKEVQVCALIKRGLQTKEIAKAMGVKPSTVETHRKRIRAKLGLRGSGIHLASHLRNL